jgi:hypothetical protein
LTTSTHAFGVAQKRWDVSGQPQTPLRQTSVGLQGSSQAPQCAAFDRMSVHAFVEAQ